MRKQKFNNTARKIDGQYFRSTKEAVWYLKFKQSKQNGDINDFWCQYRFKFPMGISYYADFKVLYSNNKIVYYDIKGYRTPIYKIKIKLLRYFYPDINFREL